MLEGEGRHVEGVFDKLLVLFSSPMASAHKMRMNFLYDLALEGRVMFLTKGISLKHKYLGSSK